MEQILFYAQQEMDLYNFEAARALLNEGIREFGKCAALLRMRSCLVLLEGMALDSQRDADPGF